jgi:hypothetical protein
MSDLARWPADAQEHREHGCREHREHQGVTKVLLVKLLKTNERTPVTPVTPKNTSSQEKWPVKSVLGRDRSDPCARPATTTRKWSTEAMSEAKQPELSERLPGEKIVYRGRQWIVSTHGLEGPDVYWIEKDRLNEINWP